MLVVNGLKSSRSLRIRRVWASDGGITLSFFLNHGGEDRSATVKFQIDRRKRGVDN